MQRLLGPVILGLVAAAVALAFIPRLASTTAPPVAMAQPPSATKGITVAGVGRVTVKPDVARIRLGVLTQAETAAAAQQSNAQKMDSVLSALKALGVVEKDIQTSSVSLRPIYEQGRDVNRQQIVGYEASDTLIVRVTDLDKVGPLLDEAVRIGANTAGGVQFGLQSDAEQRKEALKKAVQDAQGRAEVIAGAAGRTLGAAESIVEESISFPRPMDDIRAIEAASAAPTPIEPGELEITASVRVVYGF